ncbi:MULTISPECIES: DUF4391 domain-containing protein [unclassified Moraxella]|uniref:DUF4391 domain-containing protein n=1 Tax=unclassified Moraxella TaxID=2685852 RepID=UPI002B416490|nr:MULTISPECIES: DUF4391 domain-containing protein [unclassified Moraxella]
MLLNYPISAKVDKLIAKTTFYQKGNANRHIERLFVEQIQSIHWAYKLSGDTINLSSTDKMPEIQIFVINSRVADLSLEILAFIDKLIPSCIIFEIVYQDKIKVIATNKRPNENDPQKVVLGAYYASDWQMPNTRQDLPMVLTLSALYEWMIEQLLINASGLSGKQLSPSDPKTNWTIDDKIQQAQKIATLTKEIQALQNKIHKEKQFNRQVHMNLVLQKLKRQLNDLTSVL